MDYYLTQYLSFVICLIWTSLTLVGFFRGKAFNPIGKLHKFNRDFSLRFVKRTYTASYGDDFFWFIPLGYSQVSFWLATAFNILFIVLFLLLGLGIIHFE